MQDQRQQVQDQVRVRYRQQVRQRDLWSIHFLCLPGIRVHLDLQHKWVKNGTGILVRASWETEWSLQAAYRVLLMRAMRVQGPFERKKVK